MNFAATWIANVGSQHNAPLNADLPASATFVPAIKEAETDMAAGPAVDAKAQSRWVPPDIQKTSSLAGRGFFFDDKDHQNRYTNSPPTHQ